MQNAALKQCEIGMQYARFHIRANELRSALRFLRELDFIGVNLTVPHKIAGFAQIDEADERANRTGTVNTIRLRDKKLIGSNTDGEGFLRAIRSEFSVDVRDRKSTRLNSSHRCISYAVSHLDLHSFPTRRSSDLDFIGVNLTVPHKIAGFAQIDEADERANRTGTVNTIRLRDKKLIGSNTDGEGFLRAIRSEFSVDVRDLRVMVIGAGGGTGHAIAWQCALENCERLVLVNRTGEKAKALAHRLESFFAGPRVLGPVARLEAVPWDEAALRAQLPHVDLLVNATPLGMNPSDPSPIPTRLLAPHHMVFDAIYGPSRTSFLRAADQAGARGVNGLSMLLHQGALSFSIWFDREAPIDAMRAALVL